MSLSVFDFLAAGLLQFSWGEMLLYLLLATQPTIFSAPPYLPRSQPHPRADFPDEGILGPPILAQGIGFERGRKLIFQI